MKTLRPADVVIIGGGWTGLLMAKELGARTSLSVVVLERGRMRGLAEYQTDMDELDYKIRHRMIQDISKETVTVRHTSSDLALPVRQYGSFLAGTGVGGAGEHWGAQCPRNLPDCFELLTRTTQRYGAKRLPPDNAIQDWGITWDQIEPYYTRVERMVGVSGKAGNLRGKLIEGGNIFEGPRSTEFPTPPTKIPAMSALFRDAAKSLGYHPYPVPSATTSVAYINPDGISRPGCIYCGYCMPFGCMIGAKAQPTNTLLPIIQKQKKISIRTHSWVRRILHYNTPNGRRARGVTYIDEKGEEVFQPADLVFLGTWTLNNNKLLFLSDIGEPYNPATGKGTLGRNLTHQVSFPAVRLFFDRPFNKFMGSAAAGIWMSDFEGDVFDHTNLPFLRGGTFQVIGVGFQPMTSFGQVPPSVKSEWGEDWKKSAVYYYDKTCRVSFVGEHMPYKSNYTSLDPTYKDYAGDPLLRLTIDWTDNERKMVEFATQKAIAIGRAMGAKEIVPYPGYGHYSASRPQSTHVQGGTIMGVSPENSVINPFLQHWQVSNLFVLGASSFPNQGAANPTPTLMALAYRCADAVVDRYLKNPGMLA